MMSTLLRPAVSLIVLTLAIVLAVDRQARCQHARAPVDRDDTPIHVADDFLLLSEVIAAMSPGAHLIITVPELENVPPATITLSPDIAVVRA